MTPAQQLARRRLAVEFQTSPDGMPVLVRRRRQPDEPAPRPVPARPWWRRWLEAWR